MTERVEHRFPPVYDRNSKVLILGTMPSPKSREQGFYYGHPRNRFWPVLASVLGEACPETIEEKKAMVLSHGIALWDVLASCRIRGADDSSIRDPEANDMRRILEQADIRAVFATGTKAAALYRRFCREQTGMDAEALPSTSPANCRITAEELEKEYRRILPYLDKG